MSYANLLDTDLFTHHVGTYANPQGPDLLARVEPFFDWQERRRQTGTWPYSRALDGAPTAAGAVRSEVGARYTGLNFASQDYLSLSTHPAVVEAAHRAIAEHGLHSAGSAMLGGNTQPSLALERALAEHLETPHVALFSTGWGAGFGAIAGLVRPADHVVLDELSHACLQQGATAATRNVHRFRHLDTAGLRERLARIRAEDARNGILVVTEGLFSMDSDVPALAEVQAVCREHGATLLVDVAHDFGQLGPRGTGSMGAQGLLGTVDLVVGAFSKTLGTNGGFLATRSAAVRQFVKVFGGPHIFSNALSPVQAAVAAAALRLVRAAEGDALRARLSANVEALRGALAAEGVRCYGEPSAVVPVAVGDNAVARVAGKLLLERGVFANLVEYPAVPRSSARFRMQVMATHSIAQARAAAANVAGAIADARAMVSEPAAEAAVPAGGEAREAVAA